MGSRQWWQVVPPSIGLASCDDLQQLSDRGHGKLKKAMPWVMVPVGLPLQDTNLAVVAIGYGDGYPRNAPSGTPVLINGQRYADCRAGVDGYDDGRYRPAAGAGGRCSVVLWGEQLPVEEIAELVQTIPYELLCNITSQGTIAVYR